MISAVVLAAGKGTRMKSTIPKVLHKLGDRCLIDVVLEKVCGIADQTVVVVGYRAEDVKRHVKAVFPHVEFTVQEEQLGTGHAVLVTLNVIKGEYVLVMPGDMPLVSKNSLLTLVEAVKSGANAAVLVAELEDPTGYGRVIMDSGLVIRIVEELDADPKERVVKTVNTGVYCFERRVLEEYLPKLDCNNAKGEYYLTDIVGLMASQGLKVVPVYAEPIEGMGVNTRKQLAEVYAVMNRKKVEELMESGVTILAPETVFVDEAVEIAPDTVIYPFVFIKGRTSIGSMCEIMPFSVVKDAKIGDRVVIKEHCVIEGVTVEEEAVIGPFARLRPETVVKRNARIGNFVEIKKSVIGENSKANHLAYIGDAFVGKDVNIGAGTITCNYDGVKKHQTVIEDEVFIGSDTQLVAPVRVGRGALIGAGSTITKDVPPEALAVSRAPQQVFKGKGIRYFKKKKYGIE